MSRRQFLSLLVPLLAVLVGFVTLTILERGGAGSPVWDADFAELVRHRFARDHVAGVGDERKQEEAYFRALNAWLQTFDRDYAEVTPPWEVLSRRERSSGQYYGVGIRPGAVTEQGLPIVGVKPGGPADKAGVHVGDVITAVDGVAVATFSDVTALAEAIRGEKDVPVRLGLLAPDGAARDVDVIRGAVDEGSVYGARFVDEEARIGYVRLYGFRLDTARELRAAIQRMIEQGLRGLVLDLRYNSGGLLPQAVEVADVFLDEGVIVRVRGRGREFTETHSATAKDTLAPDLPLAVLVNGDSASASEVVAGALRDHRRAVLVGERTYGKFLVQTVEEYKTDYGPALFKRTTAIYETPNGHSYPRTSSDADVLAGIPPDLLVQLDAEENRELITRFENERYADWNPDWKAPESDFVDLQLAAAVDVLTGREHYPRLPRATPQ